MLRITRLRPATVAALASLLLAFAACGAGDEATSETEGEASAPERAADPAAPAPVGRPAAEAAGTAPDEGEASTAAPRDLAAFHGEYGPPDDPDGPRTWWVATEPCEGEALQVGAMWGDVAPWTVAPESATAFAGSGFGGRSIRATFGPAGETPQTLRLEVGDDTWELVRVGDLPEGFEPVCRRG